MEVQLNFYLSFIWGQKSYDVSRVDEKAFTANTLPLYIWFQALPIKYCLLKSSFFCLSHKQKVKRHICSINWSTINVKVCLTVKIQSSTKITAPIVLISTINISSLLSLILCTKKGWKEADAFVLQRRREVHCRLTKRQSTWLDLIWLWTRCWSGKAALSPWQQASTKKKTRFQLGLA